MKFTLWYAGPGQRVFIGRLGQEGGNIVSYEWFCPNVRSLPFARLSWEGRAWPRFSA
ncbi:hypothetical protein ACVFVO_02720 [Advenella kashmirensis]